MPRWDELELDDADWQQGRGVMTAGPDGRDSWRGLWVTLAKAFGDLLSESHRLLRRLPDLYDPAIGIQDSCETPRIRRPIIWDQDLDTPSSQECDR